MKELFNSITKKEWRFVAMMAIIMIVITSLPYLVAYLMTPADNVYDGVHALSPGDIPVYYSYINQVKEGNFLVKDLFTAETQDPGTFNVWWFSVGILAKIFNLSVISAFQLSRLLMIPVFLFIAYLFISFFVRESVKRKVAFIFLLFSGGLGFYFAAGIDQLNIPDSVYYSWPIDLWLTEALTFNALYQSSHFIASLIFTFLIFLFILLSFEKKNLAYAVIGGFLALIYFNFHPYYVPVIFGVAGLYLFILMLQERKILWEQTGYLLLVFLISLPSVIYHFWLVQNSPAIGQRALQNITEISPLIFVLIGYGFLWLGLGLGLFFLLINKNLNNRLMFLLVWLTVNLLLIYSSLPFHSRYTQGIHFILVIFTVLGLFSFWDYLKIKLRPKFFNFWIDNIFLWAVLFLFLFGTSVFYTLARDVYYFIQKPAKVATSLYLPDDVLAGISWLEKQPRPKLILASALVSMFIPGFSGQTVYVAHAHETLFFYSKIIYLAYFFSDDQNDDIKYQFLKQQNIDYVFYSDYEKKLGSFNPAEKNYLRLVFDSPQAQVYQVVK